VPRALFVYWRADPATLPATLQAVAAAQARLRRDWPGLDARLWQRHDTDAAPTVMETYSAPGGIEAAGQARIEAAMQGLAPGPRHIEAFEPVPPVRPD
jgi:hypothetical protein